MAFLCMIPTGFLLTSCSEDEPTMEGSGGSGGEGGTLLSPAEAKTRMESVATQVLQKLDATDQRELIELLSYIEEYYFADVVEAGDLAEVQIVSEADYSDQVFRRTVRSLQGIVGGNLMKSVDLSRAMAKEDWHIEDYYGYYQYDEEEGEFVNTGVAANIVFEFLDRDGYVVTLLIEPSSECTTWQAPEQLVYIPTSAVITLNSGKAGDLLVAHIKNVTTRVGTELSTSVELQIGDWRTWFELNVLPDMASFEGYFTIDDEYLMSLKGELQGNGLAGETDEPVTEETFEQMQVGEGAFSVGFLEDELMFISRIGNCDEFFALSNSWDTEAEAQAGAEQWNQMHDTYFTFDKGNTEHGKIIFQPYLDYAYEGLYHSYESWSIEPILLFKDDSKYAFESYFTEQNFPTVVELLEALAADVEAIWNGSAQ